MPNDHENNAPQDVLEQIAERAPHSGWRAKLRSMLFPRSHHRIMHIIGKGDDSPAPRFDWFEAVSLAAILVNSVILALVDPLDRGSVRNQVADYTDAALTFFFVLEALLRLTCFGSVLLQADRWFDVDCLVVVGSFVALILSFTGIAGDDAISFSGLRSFRLLKPIRSLRGISAARLIIGAITTAVEALSDVVLLLAMLLLLFGVGGVSQYNSRLRKRCISWDYTTQRIRDYYPLDISVFTPYGLYETSMFRDFEPLFLWSSMTPPSPNVNVSGHWGHTINDLWTLCNDSRLLQSAMLFELMDDTQLFPNLTLPCAVFGGNHTALNATNSHTGNLYRRCSVFNYSGSTPEPTRAPTISNVTNATNGTNTPNGTAVRWITSSIHGLDLFDRFLQSLGTDTDAYEYKSIWLHRDSVGPWEGDLWTDQTCNDVNSVVLQGYKCPYGYACADVGNPSFGILGFDNLLQALLAVFMCTTYEQWFTLSGSMADAVDDTAQFYFLAVVLIGGLFVLNLVVAQLTFSFEDAYLEEKEHLKEEQAAEKAEQILEPEQPLQTSVVEQQTKKIANAITTMGSWFKHRMDEDRVVFDDNDSDDEEMKRQEELRAAEEDQHDRMRRDFEAGSAFSRTQSFASGAYSPHQLGATANSLQSIAGFVDHSSGGSVAPSLEAIRRKRALLRDAKRIRSMADLRARLVTALGSTTGQLIVCTVILLMLAQMAVEHHGMSAELRGVMDILSLTFNCIFTVEVLLRWFAYGFFGYFRQVTNVIDIFVVSMSWLDFGIEELDVPIIRALRLLRFYAVFKTFDRLRFWIVVIRQTLRAATVLAIVSTCALFITACLGMQLFGGQFCNLGWADARPDNTNPNCLNRPRANFDTFAHAMLTAFQIMSGDNWDNVAVDGIRAQGGITALFFVTWLLLSNLVLVNLVIAIVLSARAEVVERETTKRLEEEELLRRKREADPDYNPKKYEDERKLAAERSDKVDQADIDARGRHADEDQHTTRAALRDLLRATAARRSILLIVCISSLLMAFESPFDAPNSTIATILRNCDLAASVIFLVEMSLKLWANGVWDGPDAYLRSSVWNIVDVAVVVAGLVASILLSWSPIHMGSDGKKLLQILRALRPLRFVSISASMRHVLGMLALSIAPLRHLFIVILVVFTFWGILGVQLFSGTFYSCTNSTILFQSNCTSAGYDWVNAPLHFNHLGAAYTSLFSIVTLDGWMYVMWNGVDAVAVGHGFEVNYNMSAALYFISFVVVASFFFLNLFVSVLIEGYKESKVNGLSRDGKGNPFLTPKQNAWIRSHHVLLNLVPQVDYDDDDTTEHNKFLASFIRVRKHVRVFVRHPLFDVVVYCFIVVNFIVLAADRHPKSDAMTLVVTLANTTFTVLFACELILRITADTPRRFFFYKWNQFDTVIVVTSLASLVLEYLFESTTFASFFRTLRVLRLLRLLRKARRLQIVLKRFVLTLFSLKNIAALIGLLFMIFGVIGVKLFGRVARNDYLTRRSNFADFGNALIMLLRMCTAGEWTNVMVRCSSTAEDSDCDPQLDNCGMNVVAQLYFIIFITVGSFVVLNLFVAVVLDTFTADKEMDFTFLTDWEGGQLLQLWLRFDPEFTYRMESRFFVSFLRSIPATSVLGRVAALPKRQRLRHELVYVASLRLHEHGGLIELQDAIFAVCRRAYAFPRRRVRVTEEHYDPNFDDPLDPNGEMVPQGRAQELHILDSRRLDRKADMWFRRDTREVTRPMGETFDVSFRFAAMILEQYWLRRKAVQKRLEFFRQRAKERQELAALEEIQRKMAATGKVDEPKDKAKATRDASRVSPPVTGLTGTGTKDAKKPGDSPAAAPPRTGDVNASPRPSSAASPATAPLAASPATADSVVRAKGTAHMPTGDVAASSALAPPLPTRKHGAAKAALALDDILAGHEDAAHHEDRLRQLAGTTVPLSRLPKHVRKEMERHVQALAAAMHRVGLVKEELRLLQSGGAERPRTHDELIALGKVLHEHQVTVQRAAQLRREHDAAVQAAVEAAAEAQRQKTRAEAAAASPPSARTKADDDTDDEDFKALF
jgi:cell division protein FtsL